MKAYNQGVDRYQQNDYDSRLELLTTPSTRNPGVCQRLPLPGMTYARPGN